MRKAFLLAGLLALSLRASAQVEAIGYVMPQVGEKFWIQVSLICPPPSEPAPPRHCNGSGVTTTIEASDPRAQKPSQARIVVNQTVTVGPFKFQAAGVGFVRFIGPDGPDDEVAIAGFNVQPRR